MNKANMSSSKGFTLIEILVYMGLFAIIIGGGMVAVYQIIESTNKTTEKVIIQEDANFMLRKLDWALTGATEVTATPTTLTVTNYETSLVFNLASDNMTLNSAQLNSSFVDVAQVSGVNVFTYDSTAKKVDVIFTVNGQRFDQTRYLR
jgi:type II secretory pathway pseudopilin PulG